MSNKKEALSSVNEGMRSLVDIISSKLASGQSQGKEIFSSLSKNLKDSIHDTSEKAADFINSLKKDKIRSLEKLLNVDKKDLMTSNKKSFIYSNESGKMVIVERDIWGDPCTVTIKDSNKVELKMVKFFKNRPYLFPPFSEKKINGDIIFMGEKEIWYRNKDDVTVVLFEDETPDFLNINLKGVQNFKEKDVLDYIEKRKRLYIDEKLRNLLLDERQIDINDICKISSNHTIYKNSSGSYTVLLFDEFKELYKEFTLRKVPDLSDEAMTLIFSKDIAEYIFSKGYEFESFKQSGNHIEYWQDIGRNKVCVMRVKI
ncbi:hypothetical protein [Acetivibrio saccincola]|uniref:Uncharacterized protein n=1 Tax=Acetivibrio saccincola TaxID=1677857 RepID=A0A2K9EK52_9FIRM|nr:hypothetical protein [Acetivibrio saccincola]AUG58373.1 hypothetical protein HVS_12500 [Acetivibrio saccincola]PQQ66415.1 hypothetical protein B9R14_06390 [Acetivibrio saccincola]